MQSVSRRVRKRWNKSTGSLVQKCHLISNQYVKFYTFPPISKKGKRKACFRLYYTN